MFEWLDSGFCQSAIKDDSMGSYEQFLVKGQKASELAMQLYLLVYTFENCNWIFFFFFQFIHFCTSRKPQAVAAW